MFDYVKKNHESLFSKAIYRHFQVGFAIIFRIGHVACTHVHLKRWNDQARHA
jgi:hypothetical protein